ncbi:hypothetical protein [Echinococcus multilocularis]|uniref:Uncharacterized protein n=1 Tax=Echinococcus multilocularis TaxID=6211 RepID=A0A068Y6I2_ECHMU|nr:hypothetical protein [Echinococcus multilocularis]
MPPMQYSETSLKTKEDLTLESFDDGLVGEMCAHTHECDGTRRFEIKSELEKRLSRLNLEVLDTNYRRLSLHTRAREHRPVTGTECQTETAEATSSKHAPPSPAPCRPAKTCGGNDREVYKSNVMLIIGAATRYRIACKADENHLIQAAANIITNTAMRSQK